jgi:sialidase-1
MVVKISNDEGKSWQKEIPIYSGSAAYSCMTQLPNGNVGLLYEADKYNKLVFVEIPSGMLIK